MAVRCFKPLTGKRIRVTQLNECGAYGQTIGTEPPSMVVTDGFITITMSAEVEEGAEIITKNASGGLCVNERLASSFKRMNVELEFCGVDPGLLSLVTNGEVYEDYNSDPNGLVIPEGTITKKFALEIWTGLSGEACAPGVEEASGYFVLPFVQAGVLGDMPVEGENATTFSLTGSYTKGGNQWGVGPYNVIDNNAVPSPLPTALNPLDHLLLMPTNIAPPPSACGLQTFTADTPPVAA